MSCGTLMRCQHFDPGFRSQTNDKDGAHSVSDNVLRVYMLPRTRSYCTIPRSGYPIPTHTRFESQPRQQRNVRSQVLRPPCPKILPAPSAAEAFGLVHFNIRHECNCEWHLLLLLTSLTCIPEQHALRRFIRDAANPC